MGSPATGHCEKAAVVPASQPGSPKAKASSQGPCLSFCNEHGNDIGEGAWRGSKCSKRKKGYFCHSVREVGWVGH